MKALVRVRKVVETQKYMFPLAVIMYCNIMYTCMCTLACTAAKVDLKLTPHLSLAPPLYSMVMDGPCQRSSEVRVGKYCTSDKQCVTCVT